MNHDQNETTALQTVDNIPAPQISTTSASLILNGDAMERIFKFAEMMASARVTIPQHLQKNPGDCLAVAMQAVQWGMHPFAVAQKTHVTQGGALGYEAQLISAVVTANAPVTGQPEYEYIGDWSKVLGKVEERKSDKGGKYYVATYTKADEAGLGVICRLTLKGESSPREMTVMMSQCYPRFSTQWATDPKQQISYVAIRKWSRLYAPGVILGVYAPDELEDQAPPRDMGAVEVVTPVIAPKLSEAAKQAAAGGKKAFATWFKSISEEDRNKLTPMRPELEEIWVKADASRTMENQPVSDKPKEPAQAAQDAPVVTFDSVMQKLTSAQNLDALYVAADWIGEVPDPADRAKLTAKFDELVPGFGG